MAAWSDNPPLPAAFYSQDAVTVAQALLGCVLVRDPVRLRITETEAYRREDTACHAHRGRTPRNAAMFGPPGHAYVYLCYGIHHLLNLVTEPEGEPAAVLIRAATVLEGEDVVRARRGGRIDLVGPGKVGQALDLDTSWSGRPLDGELRVLPGEPGPGERILAGPRVGIDYALPEHRDLPWRFRLFR